MTEKKYSAGIIKHSFWFIEFKKTIMLLNDGINLAEIKRLSETENIFAAPSKTRATETFNTVSRRIRSLPSDFPSLFVHEDVSTQKILALISIMNIDRLFFEFIHEVYREKLILGDEELLNSDIRTFFNKKESQSERVAGWTDYTFQKLTTCYKTMLINSGAAVREGIRLIIARPVLSQKSETYLRGKQMSSFLNALTGDR